MSLSLVELVSSEQQTHGFSDTQRQRLINTQTLTNGDSDVPPKGRRGTKTGRSAAERRLSIRHSDQEAGVQMEDEKNGNDEEEEEDGEGPFVPFHCPGRSQSRLEFEHSTVTASWKAADINQ